VYANRRLAAGVRGLFIALLVAILAAVVGCVPSRPNDLPLQLSIQSGEVVFRWCGDEIPGVEEIQIDYATFRPQRVDKAAATIEGLFMLSPGVQFSASQPPAGAISREVHPVPLGGGRILIFVFISASDPSVYLPSASYAISNREPSPGAWIWPDGSAASPRC